MSESIVMLASPSASTIASRLDAEYSVAPSPKPMSAQSPPSAASSHTVLCVSVAIELDALTYGQMHVVFQYDVPNAAGYLRDVEDRQGERGGGAGPRRHPRERARGVAVVARAVAVVAHVVSQHGAPMHCAAYTSEHEVTLLVKYGSAVE